MRPAASRDRAGPRLGEHLLHLLLEAATNLLRLFPPPIGTPSQGLRAEISCGVRLQVLRGVSRSVPAKRATNAASARCSFTRPLKRSSPGAAALTCLLRKRAMFTATQ